MARTSVAFVDDHPVLLEGIGEIFRKKPEYLILATGSTASDAVAIAQKKNPDVIVLDLNMPGDAFEAIRQICEKTPQCRIVVFTAHPGIDYAVKALEVGATGYVLKGAAISELTAAIGAVAAGDTFIMPGFATKVIAALRAPCESPAKTAVPKLSFREEQIVKLLHLGRTNKEIARDLNISEKTVKHYMTLLMQKMQVRNRVGVVLASQHAVHLSGKPALFN